MGGGNSPSGNTTTTQKAEPWSGQIPFLTGGTNSQGSSVPGVFNEAAKLYTDPSLRPQFYPGDVVANFTPTQQAAQALTVNRALNGSAPVTAAQNNLASTENGDFLSAGNPYFSNMLSSSLSSVLPNVDAQFGGSGNAFSSARNNAISDAVAKTAGNLAYQNYSDERGNQIKGMLFAPTLAAQDYTDLGALASVGDQQQAQNQAETNADIQRFNFNQQLPANMLAQYQGFVNGNYGGTNTLTQPYYGGGGGGLGGALGGAASGAMMGSMFGPWGTAIGAGVGLLGSL